VILTDYFKGKITGQNMSAESFMVQIFSILCLNENQRILVSVGLSGKLLKKKLMTLT
jgi:hypothetical protein